MIQPASPLPWMNNQPDPPNINDRDYDHRQQARDRGDRFIFGLVITGMWRNGGDALYELERKGLSQGAGI